MNQYVMWTVILLKNNNEIENLKGEDIMYAYALVCFLDNETEQYIRKLWKGLSENNISKYGVESEDKRPHITIADYDTLNKEAFIDLMNKFYDDKVKVDITLNILGTFINSGTLFISPTLSNELLDFHKIHHEYFEVFNDNENSFYLPSRWIPHCTIASRLNEENMVSAFEFCSKELSTIKGKLSEIALIEVQYNDAGIAVGSSTIFLKELRHIQINN